MTKFTLFILLSSLLTSCFWNKDAGIDGSQGQLNEEKARIENENETARKKLLMKTGAWLGWDTGYIFTYELQERMVNNARLIAFPAFVNDIFKKDSTYYLALGHGSPDNVFSESERRDYQAYVRVEPGLFSILMENMKTQQNIAFGMFILMVQSVTPYTPQLKHDVADDWYGSDNYPEIEASLDYGHTYLVFRGQLIDFCLYKEYDD